MSLRLLPDRRHAPPPRTIPAIVLRAVRVCGANNAPVPGTIVGGSIVTRPISTVRRGVPAAVISWTIAAIIAISGSAIVTVTWAVSVRAGGYATDHRACNKSARETRTPTPTTPPRMSGRWGHQGSGTNGG